MGTSIQPSFAYLADGKLFRVNAGAPPSPIESQFVKSAEDRRAQSRERNSFRGKGLMWNLGQPMGMDFAEEQAAMADARPVRFTGMTTGPSDHEIYYALQTETVGGLFLFDLASGYERRLVHRQNLELRDLTRSPANGDIACSLPTGNGAVNLGLMNAEGGELKEITSGDSIDESPAWAPGRDQTIVFQSAGIGRHENGAIFGLGPYAICELNLADGSLKTVLESETIDYLSPRAGADGSLYYIRRPYQIRPSVSPLRLMGDVALFPFRVGRAFVHFLNSFSMMFSKKPLITAGGPRREGPDRRAMMLWGRWVEVERKLRYARPDADPPLVPSDWRLVRREADGAETALATSVVAFDVSPAGDLIYTNGSAIYGVTPGETPRRLARARFVERVAALR